MIWFLGSPVWFQKLSSMILLGSFLPLLGPFQLGIFCDSVLLTVRWTKSTERCKQYASWHKHLSNNWGMIVVFFFFSPTRKYWYVSFLTHQLKMLWKSLFTRNVFTYENDICWTLSFKRYSCQLCFSVKTSNKVCVLCWTARNSGWLEICCTGYDTLWLKDLSIYFGTSFWDVLSIYFGTI